MILLRFLPGLLLAVLAAAQPIPAEHFFAPSAFLRPQLSADGTKVCALVRYDKTHRALVMIDLATKQTTMLVKMAGVDVGNFWWKDGDLVLALVESDEGNRGFRSIDVKTGKVNPLEPLLYYPFVEFVHPLPDAPEDMLFAFKRVRKDSYDLTRANLRTGMAKLAERDPGGVETWLVNRTGTAIAALGRNDSGQFLLWRPDGQSPWNRQSTPKGELPAIVPLAVAPDQRRLLVQDFRRGSTAAVSYFDPATAETEELLPPAEVESSGLVSWGRHSEPAGIVYETDRRRVHFIHPQAEQVDRWLETVMPGMRRIYLSFSQDNNVILLFASNSQHPGFYCVANVATRKITRLGSPYPGIKPEQLAPSRHFGFKARDGLTITGRITSPAGVAKPPCLLITPWDLNGPRSEDEYDSKAQFFASRGIATVYINQRGTAGFGRDFSQAGERQITGAMVDDLEDGLRWITGQGWVDGSRLAALGQGHGGWIAFPLAARPGLLRSLVNLGTISDTDDASTTGLAGNVLPSGRDENTVFAASGGRKAVKEYRRSISPALAAAKLTIPTFNYYWQKVDAGDLIKAFKQSGKEHTFVTSTDLGAPQSADRPQWERTTVLYEQVAAFLQQHF